MESQNDDPRESGGESQSAAAAKERVSLRARLMNRFSVAVGRKKKRASRQSTPSNGSNVRRSSPLPATTELPIENVDTLEDKHVAATGESTTTEDKPSTAASNATNDVPNENVTSEEKADGVAVTTEIPKENEKEDELSPPPKPEKKKEPSSTFTTGSPAADESGPKLPPNKPKPRGSILNRMRRASRSAVEFVAPRDAQNNAANEEDAPPKPEKPEHLRPGGLQALRNVFSGRKLGLAASDQKKDDALSSPSSGSRNLFANASASANSTADKGKSETVQSGTVKSLVSQRNSKAASKETPKASAPAFKQTTKFEPKTSQVEDIRPKSSVASRFDEVRSSNGGAKPTVVTKPDENKEGGSLRGTNSLNKVKFDDAAARASSGGSKAGAKNSGSNKSDSESVGERRPGSTSMGRSRSKKSIDGHRISSRKSLGGKYRSTAAGVEGLELSLHEQAFMPGDLLKRLGASAGQLPPAPSVFSGQGAVLFVDVSGFTRLAERLNKDNVPVKASEKLANTITRVLEALAQVCLDCGGEIGKFAGDALLCVWESADLNKAELLAKHCAVNMLLEMENLNRIEKVDLQIHGGVAKGSIVHFHFGSSDDDLRWYLISGEAVAAATTLVDVANAGEFCCQDGIAKGLPTILDESDISPRADGRKGLKFTKDYDGGGNMFSSFRGILPKANSTKLKDKGGDDAPRHTKSLARGKKQIPTTFLTSSSDLPPQPDFPAEHSLVAAVLKDGLPRSCNVYIPSSLRDQLNERSEKKGEMRRRIAAMFVEISSLVMTEDELLKQTVSDAKLDSLNSAFVTMTRIVHAFEGEVRDMLFDDKGCVYIAIFGAHCEEEKEHHPWNLLATKAAMAIVNEIPAARVGVSIGTCFVGMAGVIERRTDFVVVGHEVNMSARYMSNARPGQVLVSSGIHGSTKEQIKYGPEIHIMVGKGEYAKQRTVYSPLEESHRRASFQATYRRSMSGAGLFIGRSNELEAIETNMNKIANGRSGVMVIEAPPGRGKSSIVTRAKRMGRGKIKVVSGQALSTERNSPYYAFRQVLEAYTGIRPAMTAQEARAAIERIEAGRGEKINVQALGQVLPWINEAAEIRSIKANGGDKNAITPDRVADTFLQIIKLNFEKSSEKSALVVLEDVHWMDRESLEMLNRLIDGLEKVQKVAILMTFRADSPDPSDGAFEAMEYAPYGEDPDAKSKEASRRELIATLKAKAKKNKFNSIWIDLPALSKLDSASFAGKLLGGELNELAAQKLWDQAKGDPFYLELLSQWLTEKNMVRQEKGGTISISCDPSAFPKTCEELIYIRCNKLSEEHRRVLQLAASGGEIFDAVYISSVSKAMATADSRPGDAFSTDQVLVGLHAAADLEIVTHITDSTLRDEAQHKWRFKHDLIYRAVWLQVQANRRAALDRVATTDRKKLALRLKSSFFDAQD